MFHPIDLDPRWVKKLAARNAASEMAAYVDHVLEQARYILETQDVVNLHATPPLVEAIARDDGLVDLVNSKIRYLLLSGAHVDMDTLDLLRADLPGHRHRHGVRKHDGAVAGGHPRRRRRRSSSTRARRTSCSG